MINSIVAVLLLLSAVAARATEPLDVSLFQLIANPNEYQGKTVRVMAFLHLEFEGNGLYLHKEDYQHALYKNGIWIDVTGPFFKSASSHNNSYVMVIGTFDATNRGHMGLWSGSISHIEQVVPWHN